MLNITQGQGADMPTLTEFNYAFQRRGGLAPDPDGRVRFLGRLGRKVQVTIDLDELAIKAGRLVRTDLFHDGNIFPRTGCPFFVRNPEQFELVCHPAHAGTEDHPSA